MTLLILLQPSYSGSDSAVRKCITVHHDISHSVAAGQAACLLGAAFLRRGSAFRQIRIGIFVHIHPAKVGFHPPRRDSGDFIPLAANQKRSHPSARYYDNTLIFICNRVLDLGGQREDLLLGVYKP